MARKEKLVELPPGLPELGTPPQVAKYLYTTEAALAQMRYMGSGPMFIKAGGRRVLYRWAAPARTARAMRSTTAPEPTS